MPDWIEYWCERLGLALRSRNYSKETEKNYRLAVKTFLARHPGPPAQVVEKPDPGLPAQSPFEGRLFPQHRKPLP